MQSIENIIAKEISVTEQQVKTAIELLDDGNTVPFIARYRKEKTDGLTDNQLRELETRLQYLRDLISRKETILKAIKEQGKLTKELEQKINEADNKARLEDLYKPYKPKRTTKGQIAKEAGLEPLANLILSEKISDLNKEAEKYINPEKEIKTAEDALNGARYIIMERFADDADLIAKLRTLFFEEGYIHSEDSKKGNNKKFADYFEHVELIKKIPSHRVLAILRGKKENALKVSLSLKENTDEICINIIKDYFKILIDDSEQSKWLMDAVRLAWKTKFLTQIEVDLISTIRKNSEEKAIQVFAENLKDILMASPAGAKVTMGLDPGLKTGVKIAIIDKTGKFLADDVIYPHAPQNKWDESIDKLLKLIKEYNVELISIGNGTASKETDKLVSELISNNKDLAVIKTVTSEAGASVYSASKVAEQEFPNLDVTVRGAISIARRLQDPLSELVKIEPKSIGVGQYQHDVSQTLLTKMLKSTVEDCVNAVGVDLNTASIELLTYISGLNKQIAKNIVEHRNNNGEFKNRESLKKVASFGDKTFEQCAGFLKVSNGDCLLDSSSVHPESYHIVNNILSFYDKSLKAVMNNKEFLKSVDIDKFVSEENGALTIQDILLELEKPGRDPRPEFKNVNFIATVNKISDLDKGMVLEGVVTNVANFGAFVDLGIKQDGLVHISEITNKYVSNPRDVIKTGDIVKVKVLDIDLERNRISLTMKLDFVKKEPKVSNKKINKPTAKANINKKTNSSEFAKTLMSAFSKKDKTEA